MAGVEYRVLRHHPEKILHGLLSPHHLGGSHYGIHQRFIAGAAAGVAVLLKPGTDLLPVRMDVLVQQCFGGYNKARGAESALHSAIYHPGKLKGMQIFCCAQSFNGQHLTVVLHHFHIPCTGAHQLTIQNHITGSAHTLAAAHLCTGKTHRTKCVSQRVLLVITQKSPLYPIDFQNSSY